MSKVAEYWRLKWLRAVEECGARNAELARLLRAAVENGGHLRDGDLVAARKALPSMRRRHADPS